MFLLHVLVACRLRANPGLQDCRERHLLAGDGVFHLDVCLRHVVSSSTKVLGICLGALVCWELCAKWCTQISTDQRILAAETDWKEKQGMVLQRFSPATL